MKGLCVWALVAVSLTAMAACGGGGGKPIFDSLPTPTIPPGFVTFTDESNVFSIGYPSDWELALSLLPDLEEVTKDLLRSSQSDLPLENIGVLFYAGLPAGEGYLPDVNIFVESLPFQMSVAEYYEAGQEAGEELLPGLKVYSRTNVVAGGREAIIEDGEFDASFFAPGETGKIRTIQLTTVDGKVGWAVTCTASIGPPASAEDLQTCKSVVRSFRIPQ